jgi:hypothetical protein
LIATQKFISLTRLWFNMHNIMFLHFSLFLHFKIFWIN